MINKYALAVILFLGSILIGAAQNTTDFIVVDQFGYRPEAEKIAVIRDPQVGHDADLSFEPGGVYSLVNEETNLSVFQSEPIIWKNGITDASSGDKCWWFDFSEIKTTGSYYVLDVEKNVRSFSFRIAEDVYAEVLKQAMRTFFYQRVGYEKEAEYAGEAWADGASHLGDLQDAEARRYDQAFFSTSERDLSGGWYDAGDYNKYTPWTSSYVIELLQAYEENIDAWGDNYCLPYSGNGIPDIIDEIKWGLDHLLKLQESDGSLISIVSLDHAYPPSAATGPSLYGAPNTISATSAAAAYAYGAKVFGELQMESYANSLLIASELAWEWIEENPNVIWKNNDAEFNSVGVGAGQQETDDYGRFAFKIRAATYLYEVTNDTKYKDFIEANYADIHLMAWNFSYPFEEHNQEALLYYANLDGVSESVASDIIGTYRQSMQSDRNFGAIDTDTDPYLSFLNDYVWGSNSTKSRKGLMFTDFIKHSVDEAQSSDAFRIAERYIHYIHGLNPLNFCYLSNMSNYGSDKGVSQFYHTWFGDGTDWDITGVSKYGPPPGYLVGGANDSYDWDSCCDNNCNSNCDPDLRERIRSQPEQKSYSDFNTSWPMNSWQLSENSCGYQVSYIRLLSKFVDATSAQNTVCTTIIDEEVPLDIPSLEKEFILYPSPASDFLKVKDGVSTKVELFDIKGQLVKKALVSFNSPLAIHQMQGGMYFAHYIINGNTLNQKIIISKN